MPTNNTTASISFAITHGPVFNSTSVLTNTGLRMLKSVTVPTDGSYTIEVNAGIVSQLAAVYLHFSAACTFTIDGGTSIDVAAGDTLGFIGLAGMSILNMLSGDGLLSSLLVTVGPAVYGAVPVVIDLCAVVTPEPV